MDDNSSMPQPISASPVIFDFLDVSQYLYAHFEWRKSQESRFTYSEWSAELNIGSKTILRFILQRKRNISAKTMAAFILNLQLDAHEAEYFENLVRYCQAKSANEKNLYGSALLRLHRKKYQQMDIAASVAANHLYGPVILTLLTFQDFPKTASSVAQALEIDLSSAEEILQDLTNQGIIHHHNGAYLFDQNAFKIRAPLGSPQLKQYYAHWLEQAKKALQAPVETRHYRSLKFALTPEEYQKILESLNEHAITLLSQLHNNNIEGRRLYMYNTTLFPVSVAQEITTSPQTKESTELT